MPRDWRQVGDAEALLDWARHAVRLFQSNEKHDTSAWNTAYEFNLLIAVAANLLGPELTALFRPFTIPDRIEQNQMQPRIRDSIFWQFQITLQQFQEYLEARNANSQLSMALRRHAGKQNDRLGSWPVPRAGSVR